MGVTIDVGEEVLGGCGVEGEAGTGSGVEVLGWARAVAEAEDREAGEVEPPYTHPSPRGMDGP